jgi:flagellar basal-body rod protein FlgB
MNPIADRGIAQVTAWLAGLGRRQGAIANNIANIDTPGFQRQDVSFETELQRAFGRQSGQLATTDPRHIAAPNARSGQLGIDPQQLLTSSRLDANTVDIDQQMILLAETQMQYQAASQILSRKLRNIRAAMNA